MPLPRYGAAPDTGNRDFIFDSKETMQMSDKDSTGGLALLNSDGTKQAKAAAPEAEAPRKPSKKSETEKTEETK